jgi:hypothetical protein
MALDEKDLEQIKALLTAMQAEQEAALMPKIHTAIGGAITSEIKPLNTKIAELTKKAAKEPDPKPVDPKPSDTKLEDRVEPIKAQDPKPSDKEVELQAKLAQTEKEVQKMQASIREIENRRIAAEKMARQTQLNSQVLTELASTKKIVPGTEQILLNELLRRGVVKESGDRYVAVIPVKNTYTNTEEPTEVSVSEALNNFFSDNSLKVFAAPIPGTGTGGGSAGQPGNQGTTPVDLEAMDDDALLAHMSKPESRQALFRKLNAA